MDRLNAACLAARISRLTLDRWLTEIGRPRPEDMGRSERAILALIVESFVIHGAPQGGHDSKSQKGGNVRWK